MRDVAVDTFPMDNLMTTSCEVRIYFARKNLLLLQKLETQKVKQYYATCLRCLWYSTFVKTRHGEQNSLK